MKSILLPLLTSLFVLLLAGCGLSSMAMKATVSGGEQMVFMLGDRGPERAKDNRATVIGATITPSLDQKHIVFSFVVEKFASAPGLKSVKVENISDEVPELLLFDEAPKLEANRFWKGNSSDRDPSDPHLIWINHEGNTARVYRVTLQWEDGKRSELFQLDVVPGFLKEMIRKTFERK